MIVPRYFSVIIRSPPRSTRSRSSAASDGYKSQGSAEPVPALSGLLPPVARHDHGTVLSEFLPCPVCRPQRVRAVRRPVTHGRSLPVDVRRPPAHRVPVSRRLARHPAGRHFRRPGQYYGTTVTDRQMIALSVCATELRLRASVNRPMRTPRAASADDSLTMITCEPPLEGPSLSRSLGR